MPSYVRLRGPQVTLQRRKRGCSSIICPKLRRWGLLPSLSVIFLSIAVASLGFFVITEMGLSQKPPPASRITARLKNPNPAQSRSSPAQKDPVLVNFTERVPPIRVLIPKSAVSSLFGDYFKIKPLLNSSTPNVQLSAQMILNSGYHIRIRNDILNYYKSIKCRNEEGVPKPNVTTTISSIETTTEPCREFTLVAKSKDRKSWWEMKTCPAYPSHLEGVQIVPSQKYLPLNLIDISSPTGLRSGGFWEPRDCISRHSLAVIIPYKDRWQHLTTLLNYLHPVLKRQQIKHKIYVVEQYGNEIFNKGTLMNAGFIEAMKDDYYQCFVFHDVDLLPQNDENMYSCPKMPRHLSVAVNELNYRLPYPELVGGALMFNTEDFFKVNGFSNFFWGWGGEDDDMAFRVFQAGLHITRPTPNLGMYTMIKHEKRKPSNPKIRMRLLMTSRRRYRLEGLNSVKYKVVEKKEFPWFTNLRIDVGETPPSFQVESMNLTMERKLGAPEEAKRFLESQKRKGYKEKEEAENEAKMQEIVLSRANLISIADRLLRQRSSEGCDKEAKQPVINQ